MALEEWCFAEIARQRPMDELIQQVIAGNECVAILGTASMLALQTETVSEVTLPLFTSQRLLAADRNRLVHDLSAVANLIGFTSSTDQSHIEAIQAANGRSVRKTQLSWMVPRIVFATRQIRDRAVEAILNFKNDLPYQYEELRNVPEERERLTGQALEYAELADLDNYRTYPTKEDADQLVLVHVSPSAEKPENVAKVEEASKSLRQVDLWMWASKSFEDGVPGGTYTVKEAIALAKKVDAADLFEHLREGSKEDQLGMRRGAVAATAAIALNFRERCTPEDLEWARDVLERASRLSEKPDVMWSSSSIIPWHQAISVARGLAGDLREGTAARSAVRDLLELIAHPLEVVSLAALEEACKLWPNDPKLTWAALTLSFSFCHVRPRPADQPRQHGETLHLPSEVQSEIEAALAFYESGSGWTIWPLPPPAWVRGQPRRERSGRRNYTEECDATEEWGEPEVFWYSKQAAEIIGRIPVDEILGSDARAAFLDFLAGVLDWTNQKNEPPWMKRKRRNRSATDIFEWTHSLGSSLGRVAGLLPISEFQTRFLTPILRLESDNCWALLSPFARSYVCTYVYDAQVVPDDAVAILDLCLGRLLQDSAFKRDAYRSGEFSGFDQPELVRTLMFVSVDRADLAARYVNGDWSEIDRILPLIDRFIRAGGWASSVMSQFLTLCERAKAHYPAEAFADQVLEIIGNGPDTLKGWHGTFILARIAALVQYFAHRDAPMRQVLAQKFLRILDMLVDMGDRRSAALQLGESFREIRLPFSQSTFPNNFA